MDADPDADRPAGERVLRIGGGLERRSRTGEGEEEGISLRVDLHPTVVGKGRAYGRTVLGERLCVALGAELVQEGSGALDVGEDERDGA